MAKKFTWTVDVEFDNGGRTNGTDGLDKGMPLIYKALRNNNTKGLFFISTEILEEQPGVVQDILNEGHNIACHGHFHHCFKEPWRQNQNMKISKTILENYSNQAHFDFRAPKFSYVFNGQPYSDPLNHVSVLKHMWYGQKITKDSVFYLHPFDIVGGKNPPNLFCKMWYSKPRKAYETFLNLLRRYPGDIRLHKDTA